jgi:hypothetical protein
VLQLTVRCDGVVNHYALYPEFDLHLELFGHVVGGHQLYRLYQLDPAESRRTKG